MVEEQTSVLPDDLRLALHAVYTTYASTATSRYAEGRREAGARLADLVAAAKAQRWPLRMLAEPCGVSDERLRQVVKEYATGAAPADAPEIPRYVRPKKTTSRRAPERPHLTRAQAERLRELAPLAMRNAGSLPADSPYRKASEELSTLIHRHHDAGVIWAELSDATREWTRWPIPAETLDQIRQAEAAGEPGPLPPELTVSGLRMRAARHR